MSRDDAIRTMLRHSTYLHEDTPPRLNWWQLGTGILIIAAIVAAGSLA